MLSIRDNIKKTLEMNINEYETAWAVLTGEPEKDYGYCIAFALMDYEETGDPVPYAKICKIKTNSYMHEYNYDFELITHNGEPITEEIPINHKTIDLDVEYLYKDFLYSISCALSDRTGEPIEKCRELFEKKDNLTRDNVENIFDDVLVID